VDAYFRRGGVAVKLRLIALTLGACLLCASCGGGPKEAAPPKLFPVKVGSKYGYINREGKIVVPPQYEYAGPFSEGLAPVNIGGGNKVDFMGKPFDGVWGFIDEKGDIVLNPVYDFVYFDFTTPGFEEGKCIVSLDDKVGFIDDTGAMVITLKGDFKESYGFSEGLAAVCCNVKDGEAKWGYLNEMGWVIAPQFDRATPFREGLALVVMDDKYTFIDKQGALVVKWFDGPAGFFSEGLAPAAVNEKWGYIDREGRFVIKPQFEEAYSFHEGLAAVEAGGRTGYINPDGKFVIAPQFDKTASVFGWKRFNEGRAPVNVGGKFGFIDREGALVIQPQFEGVGEFGGGLAGVLFDNGKNGYVTAAGKIVWMDRD
jgi:hypothetical protein